MKIVEDMEDSPKGLTKCRYYDRIAFACGCGGTGRRARFRF